MTDLHASEREQSDSYSRYSYLLLPAILLLAATVRIAALYSLRDSVYYNFLIWDEKVYHTWAVKIANGTLKSSSVYEFAPLFPYIMAFIYKVFSQDIIYIRLLNIIFGIFSCYMVYLIGKELANKGTGLAACLVAALYETFIFYSIVPLKTSLAVFLFALVIWLLVSSLNKESMIKTLFLGISIGMMLNVRPQVTVIIPILFLVILWNGCRRKSSLKMISIMLFLYVAGFLLSISPFVIRNYRVAGELALTTSQSGFNLYQSNKLDRPGPVAFATNSPFVQGIQFTIEASRRLGKKLTPKEASAYWKKETVKLIKQQPAAFFKKTVKKAVIFFQHFQMTDQYCIGFIKGFISFFRFPFFNFCLILPLGLAGLLINVIKSDKTRSDKDRSDKNWVLGVIFFFYASTLVAFFTVTRYRLPLMVILIPFAVTGIDNLFSFFSKRRYFKVSAYLGLAAVFVVIGHLPVQRTGDISAYLNTHALVLNSQGFEKEALRYWEESSRIKGRYSDFADLSLAGKYFWKGDNAKAYYYLDKIPDTSYAAANKFELVGELLMRQGQIEKAVSAYERSLEINSGQIRPRAKLMKIFSRIDKQRAKKEHEKLKYISSFYDKL